MLQALTHAHIPIPLHDWTQGAGCNLKIIPVAPSILIQWFLYLHQVPLRKLGPQIFVLHLAWCQHLSPTEANSGTALHRVLSPRVHLQRDQAGDGDAAEVCPGRGSLLHLPCGHPLRLRHLLHCHHRVWDCLSSPSPGQVREGQILHWLCTPGISRLTEGVSQSRIWSYHLMLLIIDFPRQMRLNPFSPCCLKHYSCRNVMQSLTIANPMEKKKRMLFPFFTGFSQYVTFLHAQNAHGLNSHRAIGNRPWRHYSWWNSLFIHFRF